MADDERARPGRTRAPRPARRTTRGRGCWSARRAAAAAAPGRPAAARPGWRGTARRRTASPTRRSAAGAAEQEPRELGADGVGVGAGRPARDVVDDRGVVVEHVEPLGEQRERHVRPDRARRRRRGARRPCAAAWSCPRRWDRPARPGPGPRRSSSTDRAGADHQPLGGEHDAGRGAPRCRAGRPGSCGPRAAAPRPSSSRSRASSSRSSWILRYVAADFSARFLLVVPLGLAHAGRPLGAPRDLRWRWASTRSASTRSARCRRTSERAAVTACSRGLLLGRDLVGVRRVAAAVPPHRAVAQVADPVHPLEQLAVVADHQQRARSSRRATSYSRARAAASRLLVGSSSSSTSGRAQQQPGQPELGHLAAGQLAEPAVEHRRRAGRAGPARPPRAPRRPSRRRRRPASARPSSSSRRASTRAQRAADRADAEHARRRGRTGRG